MHINHEEGTNKKQYFCQNMHICTEVKIKTCHCNVSSKSLGHIGRVGKKLVSLYGKLPFNNPHKPICCVLLVVWLECRFLDTEVDGSNPGNSMLFP